MLMDDWLTKLARDNAKAVRAYLGRYSKNPADIDDWYQEALLRLCAASKTQTLTEPRAYLFRIASNVALSRIAHRKVKANASFEVALRERNRVAEEPMHQLVQNTLSREELLLAISQLPPRCREAFVLCKIDGHSHREIAEKLHISVSTVEKHLVKGLKQCRAALLQSSSIEPSAGQTAARSKHE